MLNTKKHRKASAVLLARRPRPALPPCPRSRRSPRRQGHGDATIPDPCSASPLPSRLRPSSERRAPASSRSPAVLLRLRRTATQVKPVVNIGRIYVPRRPTRWSCPAPACRPPRSTRHGTYTGGPAVFPGRRRGRGVEAAMTIAAYSSAPARPRSSSVDDARSRSTPADSRGGRRELVDPPSSNRRRLALRRHQRDGLGLHGSLAAGITLSCSAPSDKIQKARRSPSTTGTGAHRASAPPRSRTTVKTPAPSSCYRLAASAAYDKLTFEGAGATRRAARRPVNMQPTPPGQAEPDSRSRRRRRLRRRHSSPRAPLTASPVTSSSSRRTGTTATSRGSPQAPR